MSTAEYPLDESRASLPADASLDMIVVCGGRNFRDEAFVFAVLQKLHDKYHFATLVHGDCRGVDKFAAHWGAEFVSVKAMPADWKKHGTGAGSIRNAAMLALGPDLVVAFEGGAGTANCVRQAKALGIPVFEVSAQPAAPETQP